MKRFFSLLVVLGLAATAYAGSDDPVRNVSIAAPDSVETYVVVFEAGELATVVVDGDGSTDLDLVVLDANGAVIASDTDYTDYCVVSFIPRWTGAFVVAVRNLGSLHNVYTIGSN